MDFNLRDGNLTLTCLPYTLAGSLEYDEAGGGAPAPDPGGNTAQRTPGSPGRGGYGTPPGKLGLSMLGTPTPPPP